jgi:hypothetical protein
MKQLAGGKDIENNRFPRTLKFEMYGRGKIEIPCHLSLVVIFWSFFGRFHSQLEPMTALLALPICVNIS